MVQPREKPVPTFGFFLRASASGGGVKRSVQIRDWNFQVKFSLFHEVCQPRGGPRDIRFRFGSEGGVEGSRRACLGWKMTLEWLFFGLAWGEITWRPEEETTTETSLWCVLFGAFRALMNDFYGGFGWIQQFAKQISFAVGVCFLRGMSSQTWERGLGVSRNDSICFPQGLEFN